MQKITNRLKKGSDLFLIVDSIEAAAVKYMAESRKLDEAAMRKLLQADADVRASYQRKIARGMAATGLNTSILIGK